LAFRLGKRGEGQGCDRFGIAVFQPTRGVEDLAVSRQEPDPGTLVRGFREIALRLDQDELFPVRALLATAIQTSSQGATTGLAVLAL
jgi:hypothetical protein